MVDVMLIAGYKTWQEILFQRRLYSSLGGFVDISLKMWTGRRHIVLSDRT